MMPESSLAFLILPVAFVFFFQAALSGSGLKEAVQFTLLSGAPLEASEFEGRVLSLGPLAQCPRLAPVRAFCTDKGQRWVAYDYGANGTLEEHLHGTGTKL